MASANFAPLYQRNMSRPASVLQEGRQISYDGTHREVIAQPKLPPLSPIPNSHREQVGTVV
jgi:hypothetical protein